MLFKKFNFSTITPFQKAILILGLACVLSLFLFYIMALLVSNNHDLSKIKNPNDIIEFSMTKINSQSKEKKRILPKKKQKIKSPSFKPIAPILNRLNNSALNVHIPDLIGDFGIEGTGTSSDIMPIVRINPQYPINARMRGIEGWVLLQFEITESGRVRNPKVIRSYPPNTFDQEALRAVLKWKYRPQMENGKPVSQIIKRQLDFVLKKDEE